MGRKFKGLYSSLSGEWRTPQGLFNELDREFDFNLDPCASTDSAKCGIFFGPKENGLATSWRLFGEPSRAFVNPPYGRQIGAWIKKGYEESLDGTLVVMLLPARTDTAWWHDYVMKATEIRYIRGRLHFLDEWGLDRGPAPFPSCVVIFRPLKK